MALSDVRTENSWIRTYDEKGKHISSMSSSGKEMVWIGSDFFVCIEGSWIKTYDEKCKKIAVMSSNGKIVRSVAGHSFTCIEGSWLKSYDKHCKHQNSSRA